MRSRISEGQARILTAVLKAWRDIGKEHLDDDAAVSSALTVNITCQFNLGDLRSLDRGKSHTEEDAAE